MIEQVADEDWVRVPEELLELDADALLDDVADGVEVIEGLGGMSPQKMSRLALDRVSTMENNITDGAALLHNVKFAAVALKTLSVA